MSSRAAAWLQAARPLAQANIAVPLLLGQGLAHAVSGRFSWTRFALVHLFGVLVQLFIVFANDAADWKADVMNDTHTPFSGGSRVVPEGKLTPRELASATLVMTVGIGVFGLATTLRLSLPWMLALSTLPLSLLWAYSFPPLKLSYRGGGEWLQALGMGAVLPVIGFYLQCESLAMVPWLALPPAMVLGWAGNVITSLPDTPSDRRAEKRTLPVRRGQRRARIAALLAVAVGLTGTPWVIPDAGVAAQLACVAMPAALLLVALRDVGRADAKQRDACLRFVTLSAGAATFAQLAWTAAAFWA
jgi:1,4-dihydroxy-2-naphthoate octaprenyltransferase